MGEDWRVTPLPVEDLSAARPTPPPSVRPAEPPAPASVPARGEVAPPRPARADRPATAEPVVVSARVIKTSRVPTPGSAPYKDCLTYLMLKIERVESGTYHDQEMVAAFVAMKNDEWLAPATYAVGDELHVTLIPMRQAERQIQTLQKADNLDDYTHEVYFVISGGKV